MRATRLALPWSAGAMLLGALASGCATSSPSAEDGLRVDPEIAHFSGTEQRERADSARAQVFADEVGPRVNITADFDYAGGARQVQASFHMYDDAYVVVGHLDAAGRLKIVFPAEPGDDGFVRGDKIYHVPEFFAGFADEYAWRYSDYRYRYHSTASRTDSYDAGLGYVFVIASWRPMRLDRIADGNRWQTYDVADVSYMQDPREAIEELGSVIAGDNREAYTIQYARYTTTNYGTYSYSDFDRVNSGCYDQFGFAGLASPFFFSPFGFVPGFGGSSCAGLYGRGYGYYGFGYPFGVPFVSAPPGFRPPVGLPPRVSPLFHRPQLSGILALHKPEPTSLTPVAPMGPATVNGASVYHRPGLVAEDAAPRGQGRARDGSAQLPGVADHRPTIQDMVGRRGIENGAYGFGARGAGVRDAGSASREPTWSNRGGARIAPREEGAGNVYRNQGNRGMEGTRSAPPRAAPSYSAPRSQPAARSEPSHSAPARAEGPRAASSSGSKKP